MHRTADGGRAQGLTFVEAPDLAAVTENVLADLDALAPGPFDQPVVMVRHPAVRRHLTLAIARRQGVAASLDFPAPLTLLDRLHGSTNDGSWHRSSLGWRIAALLPDLADQMPEAIARVARDPDPFVRIGFASRLAARLFDAMLHRPAMIAAWERGETALRGVADEQWQSELWRGLVAGNPVPSLVARHDAWRDAVHASTADTSRWPDALLVVGDATLPPLIRDALALLATQRPVRWHLWVPSDEALDPLRPRRRPAALTALRAIEGAIHEHTPRQHPLAAAHTILGAVQWKLSDAPVPPITPTDDDRSLLLHRCHSAVRELESLREQLAWRLGQDPSLQPHDVTLYLTELDSYLPAVDAVFGTPEPGLPYVPYTVAGRPWRNRSTVGAAIEALLAALPGRFGRREILALLDHLPIRIAAGIRAEQLRQVHTLVESARIRWGVDADDRATAYALPPLPDGTWAAGLVQLREQHPVDDHAEDDTATLVASLDAWVARLTYWRTVTGTARPAAEWQPLLETFLAELVTPFGSDDAEALQELRGTITRVLAQAAAVGSDTPLPFSALTPQIAEALEITGTSGHLRGGMRVCRLEPGTVLPARVVMIAGLDDGRFPRGGGTPPWDILLQSRRDADHDPLEGEDPDPREDALDAFRDAIRSASDAVHLSWTGRSIMDNALRSPSVAVSELLDMIDLVVTRADGVSPHTGLIVDEPLQPFAPRLFGEGSVDAGPAPLQSAATRWATAATTVRNPAERIPPFLSAPLPVPAPLATIRLDDLCAAFSDPITWFWTRTLGLPKPMDRSVEEDREPILPEDHEQLNIHRAVLDLATAGVARTTAALVERVELAYGQLGPAVVAKDDAMRAVAVAEATGHAANGIRNVALTVGSVTIEGSLDRISESAMHHVVQYPVSARLCLASWVRHLVLNATATTGTPRTTVIIGVAEDPQKVRAVYGPVEDPLTHLADLIELFEMLRRKPLPLFPKSAFEVAVAQVDGKDPAGAARKRWEPQYRQGGPPTPGERDSPIVERLFPNDELDDLHHPEFWNEFLELTERLVLPAVMHLTRGAEG